MLYIESIIVYTLLTLLMCYGAIRSQEKTIKGKLWGWMPIVLFTLVFGLRYGVGIDYNNYVEIYEDEISHYSSYWELVKETRYEWGFLVVAHLCQLLKLPVYCLFTIIAFLQILLLYKSFKDEDNVLPFIYITLIMTGFCMYDFMNTIRHYMAFCIFIYSLKYIIHNNIWKYWLCCILAVGFHHSALMLFIFYFFWIRRKGILHRPLIELVGLCLFFASAFFSQWQNMLHWFDVLIVVMGYENYIDVAEDLTLNNTIGITRILMFMVNCIIIISSREIKNYYKSDRLNILYDLFYAGTCLSYLFLGSMMFQRIIIFMSATQFIVLAYSLRYFYKTRRQGWRQFASYCIISLTILTLYSSLIYRCKDTTAAYVSYFQKDMHKVKDDLRADMMVTRFGR